jgi:hypothetical protein
LWNKEQWLRGGEYTNQLAVFFKEENIRMRLVGSNFKPVKNQSVRLWGGRLY